MSSPRRVIFLRPSLGIGGAERWALDAALALQANGWDVEIVVNQFDPRRTFPEAREGRVKITALGGRPAWLAASRFRAFSALIGQRILLRRLRQRGPAAAPDLFICDLVPHAAAWVQAEFPRARVVVYCHYPDVTIGSAHGLYRLYRDAIARRERRGMHAAHRVLANSEFTAAAVRRAFPDLPPSRLAVVYPGVAPAAAGAAAAAPLRTNLVLARFDPTKNYPLAIAAFAALRSLLTAEQFAPLRLLLAGGFDWRLPEARALVAQLAAQTQAHGLTAQVEFHFDPAAEQLAELWQRASALLHPAPAEHFGIVLVEAMARGLPVLAVAQGGPLEIVAEGITGALRPADPAAFAGVLRQWVIEPGLAATWGQAGRRRAEQHFSAERFARAFAAQADSLAVAAEAKNA